jgi:hypothetical protein
MDGMSSTKEPSPTQIARAERMRESAANGAQVRAEIAARDVAVRKNMERLREMRLAKEASEPAVVKAAPKAGAKKATSKKAAPRKLSEFLRDQQASGRRT